MKKLVYASLLTVAAASVYGQGTINFANSSATAVTNTTTMQRVVGGTAFRVAIYWLPATGSPAETNNPPTTADFDAQLVGLHEVGFAAPGIYAPGSRTIPTSSPGAFVWVQIRAWEQAFGTSYAAVLANNTPQGGRLGIAGTSNIFRVDLGDPTTIPPGNPGSMLNSGLQAFLVTPVPEPSTIGLGMLALGGLLLLRRKK
jgi:hypothetical protein